MENYDSDVLVIDEVVTELRYGYLQKLSQVPIAEAPPKPSKNLTLVYEAYICPEYFVKPIVAIPGNHLKDVQYQYEYRGRVEREMYFIKTVLLSQNDRITKWFSSGIADKRGRIWFVDP